MTALPKLYIIDKTPESPMDQPKSENRVEARTLVHQVIDHIKAGIVSGEYEPGARLREVQIAEALAVSRAPIREAFRVLEIEGWVKAFPRKGVRVRALTRQDVESIYEIRSTLDGLAARLATPRLTSTELDALERMTSEMAAAVEDGDVSRYKRLNAAFHTMFYEKSENEWLDRIAGDLTDQTNRLREVSFMIPGRLSQSLLEHEQVLEAARAGRAGEVERIMRQHLNTAGGFVVGLLQEGQPLEAAETDKGLPVAKSRGARTRSTHSLGLSRSYGTLAVMVRPGKDAEPVPVYPGPARHRVLTRYALHEVVVLREPGGSVARGLGFVEFQNGNLIECGDALRINGEMFGHVAGFDDSTLPSHLRILINLHQAGPAQDTFAHGARLLFVSQNGEEEFHA